MNALDQLRLKVSYGTIGLLWVNLGLLCLAGFFTAGGFSVPAIASCLAIAAITTGLWSRDRAGPTTRIVSSMALAAEVALLVFAFSGSAYQIDMHMYFFATLAICAAWIDWRSIIAYAALVAVHHLALFVVFPAAVFPGQSEFSRVLLHAVILILQSGVLIALTGAVVRSFDTAARAAAESIAAHKEASLRSEEAQKAGERAAEERTRHEMEKAEETRRTDIAVEQLAQALNELAAGNLAYRISQPLHGHIDGLRLSFNQSVERLESALSDVGIAARTVRADASSIQGSNDELATRTERQAASVEETAAALTEISETVSGTAKLAADVGMLVANTKTGAERSAAVVTEAVDAMSRIEQSSQQIGQIIGVIDEIAFQTNLLALNAGVEAARAGDAGKGFAVVAQEVRELAQRSAKAAKEIKELINASAEQVRHGVELVGETGSALKKIEVEVRYISDQVQLIARAASEQSGGLHSINSTINAIDENTQRNAVMVEEATAAVHSLVGEAARLETLIERFRLADRPAGASRLAA